MMQIVCMLQIPGLLYRTALAASCASVLSALVLAHYGRKEAGSAAAPINAVSHWYWGDEALSRQRFDAAHTALGYVTHHIASLFWAGLLSLFLHKQPHMNSPRRLVVASAAASAVACFVDFKVTPDRFTPGYEHRVSKAALGVTYFAFAIGLAIGTIATLAKSATKK